MEEVLDDDGGSGRHTGHDGEHYEYGGYQQQRVG